LEQWLQRVSNRKDRGKCGHQDNHIGMVCTKGLTGKEQPVIMPPSGKEQTMDINTQDWLTFNLEFPAACCEDG